eukprot:9088515-Pyramimonas_sp.AAC.1
MTSRNRRVIFGHFGHLRDAGYAESQPGGRAGGGSAGGEGPPQLCPLPSGQPRGRGGTAASSAGGDGGARRPRGGRGDAHSRSLGAHFRSLGRSRSRLRPGSARGRERRHHPGRQGERATTSE